jgi:hypothetical protein
MRNKFVKTVAAGVAVLGLGAILAQAAAPAAPQGVITAKLFLDIGGGTVVTDLTGNAKFPDKPDLIQYPSFFELYGGDDINTAAADDVYNNMGAQMLGYFYPDTTGDYVFYVCADDGANLYLSTDDTAANKKLIAQEAGWSGKRNYTGVGGGSTVEAKNSQTFTGTQWPTKDAANGGAKITLTKGKAYYIEALVKEGGGGDNLSVSIDGTLPIPGTMLSSDKATGPLVIVTQPESKTVNALDPVTFSVVVDGTPPYSFQWQRNGTDIAGAVGASYSIDRASAADNGAKFKVKVTGPTTTLTSAEATLTVNSDSVAPTITAITPSADFLSVAVTFSEPLDAATAAAAANYKITPGITVSAAALGAAPNDNRVTLTTSKMAADGELTLTVSNVKDLAGNVITANTAVVFRTPVFASGWATYQRWDNASGDPGDINAFATAIADGSIRSPDINTAVKQFGGPWGAADNYSSRVFAWFVPPSNGTYIFFLSSDDASNLYLSTDETPANKKLIAQESGWSNQYQWFTVGGGSNADDKRSDTCAASEWGGPITLQAGKKYYIEILQDEGGGGDGSDATFIKAGDADPAQSAAGMFLTGNAIATYLDPNGAKLDITTPPADTTAMELRKTTFSVKATGSSPYGSTISYQWQKAAPGSTTFADIPGATTPFYTTPALTLADSGSKYQVVCTVPTLSKVSPAATLTVTANTGPQVAGAGAVKSNSGSTFDVGVTFDIPVTEASAANKANYTISAGTIDSVTFFEPSPGVVLKVSGLTAGTSYTVTAKNITDTTGKTTASASKDFTVSKMGWGAVGANEQGLGYGKGYGVVAVAHNGFDLYSDAVGEWGTYDEATFVFEEITGDFDKKLRVEYQDNSSQWARAGLIVRDVTNFGVNRADQDAGAAGRYQKVHVNPTGPTLTGPGTAGNNSWEGNRRLEAGAATTSAGGGGNPLYPNAWCRLRRVGQVFTIFRSDDGVNWTQLGSTDFSTTAATMPDKVFVGPEFSPENGNVTEEASRGRWVAKIRDYSDTAAKAPQVAFGVGLNFGADEPNGANGGGIASFGAAGASGAVQANWNNLNGAAGTNTTIKADKLGSAEATAMTVTWTCPNTWASTGRGEENNNFTGEDKNLMLGYLDTGAATTTTVDISGIPADLTAGAGYDVYVYFLGGVPGRGGGYRVAKADGTPLTDTVVVGPSTKPTEHVLATGTKGSPGTGTYTVFRNLTESTIKVQATTADGFGFGGTPRAPLNAIQIVKASGAITGPGKMTIGYANGSITIDWQGAGTLQSNTGLSGAWTDIGSAKPYTAPATGATMFYRVKGQ